MDKQKTLLCAVAGTVKQGFGQLHADMEARKYQSAFLHQQKLALANRQLYANRRIVNAVEHQTEVTLYNTEKLLASERLASYAGGAAGENADQQF